MRNANAIAIAGGAIATALINDMIKRGLLTTQDAKIILTDAQSRLQSVATIPAPNGVGTVVSPDVTEASRIIGEIYAGLS